VTKPYSILLLCVLLVFGLSFAIPAEDVPETAYDESEGLPYEGTTPSAAVLQASACTVQTTMSSVSTFDLCFATRDGEFENRKSPSVHAVFDSLTIPDRSLRC
jgi:hypothetical protein